MRRSSSKLSAGRRYSIALAVAFSCSCNQNTSEHQIDGPRTLSGSIVVPFAGKVTIDDHAPHGEGTIFVVLNDVAKPFVPVNERRYAMCRSDGSFAFSTYRREDGVPVGKYILTVAQLKKLNKNHYVGPDRFGNRYNDPEKNKDRSAFVVDHLPPGRTDVHIQLPIKGVPPVTTPGRWALVELE
jgi:hypothetical protein